MGLRLKRYGFAVVAVAAATGFRYAIDPFAGSLSPYLLFTLAEVAAALAGGRGPGLLAVLLSSLAGHFLFVTRDPQRVAVEIFYLVLNLSVGLALTWMADAMHRSRESARRAARDSRAAHQRLTDLLSRIGDAYFSFDREWRCLFANQRAATMAGKHPKTMLGQRFGELMPGVFNPECERVLNQAVQDQLAAAYDGFAGQDGLWFELSAYPGGDTTSVFIHDSTARKQAQFAIAQSEEHFRRLFEESPVGMAIVGMDGAFVRVNKGMANMLEYSQDELIGMTTVQVTPKEDLESSGFFSPKQQAIVTGEVDRLQMEKRFVSRSGKVVLAQLNASIMRDREGRRFFLGIVENVTERKLMEGQLREEQKLESLGVLAGGIAHDFNNLLTGILGNATLGLDLAPPESPLRPLLERLVHASERAADLTRQLLAYAGKGRAVLTAIDLSVAVRDIGSLIRASFPRHVRLDLQLQSAMQAVEADPAQIQQITMNLLLNAAESIPSGREGVVRVRTFEMPATEEDLRGAFAGAQAAPGNYAVLEVADNGSGMSAETQARIFEPFFTTKFTGRGLGLSAVIGIVNSYKGALSVKSEPGGGSLFRVFLPVTKAQVQQSRPESHADLRGSGTVLIVDDEPMILGLTRSTLERFGYRVIPAASGAEAVETLRKHPGEVRIVILDMTMPGLNGAETFKRLKSIDPDVPVILSSGHGETESVGHFAGEALAGFLPKPYTAAQLAAKIKSVLPPEKSVTAG